MSLQTSHTETDELNRNFANRRSSLHAESKIQEAIAKKALLEESAAQDCAKLRKANEELKARSSRLMGLVRK